MLARKFTSSLSLALAGAFVLAIGGCGTGSGSNATVRAIDATVCPSATSLNFALSSSTTTPFATSVGFGTVSQYVGQAAATGEYALSTNNTVIAQNTSASVIAGNKYTIASTGDCDYTTTNPALAAQIVQFTDVIPSSSTLGTTSAA